MTGMRGLAIAVVLGSGLLFAGEQPVILPQPQVVRFINAGLCVADAERIKLSVTDHASCVQSRIGIGEIARRLAVLAGKAECRIPAWSAEKAGGTRLLLDLANNLHETTRAFLGAHKNLVVPARAQAYLLAFGTAPEWRNTVLIAGSDPVGLLYGCITFCQLMRKQQATVTAAAARIVDYPDFEHRILAELYMPQNRRIFQIRDVAEKVRACKRAIDDLLLLKINGLAAGRDLLEGIPGVGQQRIMRFSPAIAMSYAWIREVTDYAAERGIYFGFFNSAAVARVERVGDDPRYRDMMRLHGNIFTWADDELLEKRAREIGDAMKFFGFKFAFIHYPDTANENWINRGKLDREKFGDDRAKADAHVTAIFNRVLREVVPGVVFCPVGHPYSPFYIKMPYYRKYLRRYASMIPRDAQPCVREYDTGPFRQFCGLLARPLFLYYEPRRMITSRRGRIGLSRSMLCSSPRFDRSFMVDHKGSIIYNIWSYNQVDRLVQNQFAWNVNAPGARDDFIWPDRLCPRDGNGNEAFFSGTLSPICARIFGRQAAPEMLKLFQLRLQTAFLLQPSAIAEYFRNNRKTPHSEAPPVDFDRLMQEQCARVITADRIVTRLSGHPEYFGGVSEQREFARYYKEVKLLRWLAPINRARWDAARAMRDGHRQQALSAIDRGLKAVEAARSGLTQDIKGIDKFEQWNRGRICRVPVGPKAGNWWRPEYLDKYFRDELQALRKGITDPATAGTVQELSLTRADMLAVNERVAVAARCDMPVKLDGRLLEPVWQKAKDLPLVRVVTRQHPEPVYPHARGRARVCWDRDALYVGMVFDEDEMDSLVGTTGPRDAMFFTDDIFEIFIQPRQGGAYCHLVGNIAGRQWDAIPRRTDLGFANYVKWNPDWQYKVYVDLEHSRWQIEARIPFSVFDRENFGEIALPPLDRGAWRINLGRERRSLECSAIVACKSFHETAHYAKLVFADQ